MSGPSRTELAAARNRTIPDVLPESGQRFAVLFCGINPSLYSAATGWHFARPGNRFWPALQLSGFTERQLHPSEQHLLAGYGLGITNLVARATAQAAELTAGELARGGEILSALVSARRPSVVAVAGVTAYRTAFGNSRAVVGPQPQPLAGAQLWILPNPSGLNASWGLPRIAEAFGELRMSCDGGHPPRGDPECLPDTGDHARGALMSGARPWLPRQAQPCTTGTFGHAPWPLALVCRQWRVRSTSASYRYSAVGRGFVTHLDPVC